MGIIKRDCKRSRSIATEYDSDFLIIIIASSLALPRSSNGIASATITVATT